MLSVAGLAGNPTPCSQVLASIDDPQRMASLVTGVVNRVRHLAAAGALKIPQNSRGSSSRCAQRQERLQDHQAEVDVRAPRSSGLRRSGAMVAALCASLERHSHRIHDAL